MEKSHHSRGFMISSEVLRCLKPSRLNLDRRDLLLINGSFSLIDIQVSILIKLFWRGSTVSVRGTQEDNSLKIWCTCSLPSIRVIREVIISWEQPLSTTALILCRAKYLTRKSSVRLGIIARDWKSSPIGRRLLRNQQDVDLSTGSGHYSPISSKW